MCTFSVYTAESKALVFLHRQIPGATDLFYTCPASFQSTDVPFFSGTSNLSVYYTPDTPISKYMYTCTLYV